MANQAVPIDVSQLQLELESIQKLAPAFKKQQEIIEQLRNSIEETMAKNRVLQLLIHQKNNTVEVYNRVFERIITKRADKSGEITAEDVEEYLDTNGKPTTDDEEEKQEKEEVEEASDGEVEHDDVQEEEEVNHDSEDSFDHGESEFNSDGGIDDAVDDSEDGYCDPVMRDYH